MTTAPHAKQRIETLMMQATDARLKQHQRDAAWIKATQLNNIYKQQFGAIAVIIPDLKEWFNL